MCAPLAIGLGIGLLMNQIFNKQRNGPDPKAAPIEQPLPKIEDEAPDEVIKPEKPAAIKKPTKRAQLGLSPESTPGDLRMGSISPGVPDPGGRQSPTGVVAP